MNASNNPTHSFTETPSLKIINPRDVVIIRIPILTIGEASERLIPVSKSFKKESVPIPRHNPAITEYTTPFGVTNNFLTGKLKKSNIARAGNIEAADSIIIPKKSFILPDVRFIKKSSPA